MKKIFSQKLGLAVSLLLVSIFAFSCANDKTFQGKWEKEVNGSKMILHFTDKYFDFYHASTEMTDEEVDKGEMPWTANYSKHKVNLSGAVYTFKFKKNFKELEFSEGIPDDAWTKNNEGTWTKK